MNRIDTATKAVDLFGAGKHGFKDGNVALGIIPTDFNAAWANAVQEEILSVVEAAGLAPSGSLTQLLQAIRWLGRESGAPGTVFFTARSTPPPGSIKANFAAVSRTVYVDLFAAIGTTYGAGDGATTFNVPEGRAEFIRGLDDGRNIDVGRLLGSWQDGTWLRTVAQEWSGGDGSDGTQVHIGNAFAQEDGRSTNTGVGGTVPSGAKSPAGGAYNTSTTDNTINGAQVIDGTAALNNWIRFRSRNIALLACIKY